MKIRKMDHVGIVVNDLAAAKGTDVFSEVMQFGDTYKLVYIRGPESIIFELVGEVYK